MRISALLTSLPLDFADALRTLRHLGFAHVDLVGQAGRTEADREALADSGLLVACVSLGRNLPEGAALDATEDDARAVAVGTVKQQIEDAAQLGATHCYLTPGTSADARHLSAFGHSCGQLASHAEARNMRLCLEPIPGRALPTAATMLAWLRKQGHPNLALLLDIGHCLISEEDPCQVVIQAGELLGYVHLDDNDSVEDLHWPLLTGRLTSDLLEAFLTTLRLGGYSAGVSLEFNPGNPDPRLALQEGRQIVQTFLGYPI